MSDSWKKSDKSSWIIWKEIPPESNLLFWGNFRFLLCLCHSVFLFVFVHLLYCTFVFSFRAGECMAQPAVPTFAHQLAIWLSPCSFAILPFFVFLFFSAFCLSLLSICIFHARAGSATCRADTCLPTGLCFYLLFSLMCFSYIFLSFCFCCCASRWKQWSNLPRRHLPTNWPPKSSQAKSRSKSQALSPLLLTVTTHQPSRA